MENFAAQVNSFKEKSKRGSAVLSRYYSSQRSIRGAWKRTSWFSHLCAKQRFCLHDWSPLLEQAEKTPSSFSARFWMSCKMWLWSSLASPKTLTCVSVVAFKKWSIVRHDSPRCFETKNWRHEMILSESTALVISVLCCGVLYCGVLCCGVLCCGVPCCVVLLLIQHNHTQKHMPPSSLFPPSLILVSLSYSPP